MLVPVGRSRTAELEHPLGDPANLDLLGAFGDAVTAVVAVNVFEGLVAWRL